MDRDARAWLERAEEDLDAARYNRDGARFPHAAFLAQQAAEKALKSVLIARGEPLRKVHDLVLLAQLVAAPGTVRDACEILTPHYIEARYPTGLDAKYDEDDAGEAVAAAGEVVAWSKGQL